MGDPVKREGVSVSISCAVRREVLNFGVECGYYRPKAVFIAVVLIND